jgi:hypothetical protein
MNPETSAEANLNCASPKELAITTILCEIRDYLLTTSDTTLASKNHLTEPSNRTDSSIALLRSRLLDIATPQETMNIIVPYLFQNHSTTGSIADTTTTTPLLTNVDALQILGFLVSSHMDIIETTQEEPQRPQFLIAASKMIYKELQQRLVVTVPVVLPQSSSSQSLIETESTPSDVPFHISKELVHVLIHQACTGLDVEVSQNCHDSILLLFQSPKIAPSSSLRSLVLEGIVTIWSDAISSVTDKMKTKQERSEFGTICVRCTTLIVDIILLNDSRILEMLLLEASSTDHVHVGTLLCSLLTDLPDDDPLLQISIYDVLYKLAAERPHHPIRTQWLFQDEFIQPLLRQVGVGNDAGGDNEPDLYLGSSALRILIGICSTLIVDTSIGESNDAVTMGDVLIRDLHMALRSFEMNGNELERLAYIDAISSLASTSSAALNMVLDDPVTCEGWLRLNVAQPKIKAAILVSMANVLDRPNATSDGDVNGTLPHSSSTVSNELCMKLFSSLGRVNGTSSGVNHTDTTELLLKMVQSPIPEIRFGAYRFFEAISKYSMGGQVLMTNTNFYSNFLIRRDTIETTYEGRILKFKIVQALHDNFTLKQLLSNDIVSQLEQYLSQGPHYRKPLQWDVMTMEQ